MSELEKLPGLGKKRVTLLNKAGVFTIRELVYYLPRKYVDRTVFQKISDLKPGEPANVIAEVASSQSTGHFGRGRGQGKGRLTVQVKDQTGWMTLVFFHGVQWWEKRFVEGQDVLVFGTAQEFNGIQLVHPEVEFLKNGEIPTGKILPKYPLTEEMTNARMDHKVLSKAINGALEKFSLTEPLQTKWVRHFKLQPEKTLLLQLHNLNAMDALPELQRELKLRDLIPLSIYMAKQKRERRNKGIPLEAEGELHKRLVASLPFKLTGAQKQAVGQINGRLAEPHQFQGLLQGDVGSGKTLVAILTALTAVECGFQCAMMVPTEILALQQFESLKTFLPNLDISFDLLTGSTSTSRRSDILVKLKTGALSIIVGTHALFSSDVSFKSLAYVIIDEQHRYGVRQREALSKKGLFPHILHMTATPIPRTLTQTLYGDYELVLLREKPPGRQPVQCRLVPSAKRWNMYQYIQSSVKEGEQVFWVVPRIDEVASPDEGMGIPMRSLQELVSELKRYSNEWRIAEVHGQMDSDEKERILLQFKSGAFDILVATTIIEVGIDIPNANRMIIENPERFGLAQLHQLRGRVGRGSKASWCFMVLSDVSLPEPTYNRLKSFTETDDGFKIAEMDLQHRGAGCIAAIVKVAGKQPSQQEQEREGTNRHQCQRL